MIWNTGLLSCSAADACRICVACIDSNFGVIFCKSFNIIEADVTETTMPIVKTTMLGPNLGWLGFDIFSLQDIGVLLEFGNTIQLSPMPNTKSILGKANNCSDGLNTPH